MARAEKQAARNQEIRESRLDGESVRSLSERFELSQTRVREILRTAGEPLEGNEAAHQRALAHLDELHRYKEMTRGLAEEIPVAQASAKIGALKAWGEAINRTVALEQQLCLLPDELAQLPLERDLEMTTKRVMQVLKQNKVSTEVLDQLLSALQDE